MVAHSGKVAVFTEPEARAAFEALGGETVGWCNALAPRMLFALPRYRKGVAEKLHMPVLMCIGDHDLQASPRFAARIASLMNNVELHRYPVGHFDVYTGTLLEEIGSVQAEFLRRHLIERSSANSAAVHDVAGSRRRAARYIRGPSAMHNEPQKRAEPSTQTRGTCSFSPTPKRTGLRPVPAKPG